MEKELKIAFLITAYNNVEQLIRLVNLLGCRNGYENIFIHIDLKSDIDLIYVKSKTYPNLTIIKKFKVYWGGFNQLQSIISLIDLASKTKKYDSVVLLSGQDLPIKPYEHIKLYLKNNIYSSFISSSKIPFAGWNYKQGLGRIQWFWFLDHVHIRGTNRLHKISHYIFEKINFIRPSSKEIDFYGGSDWWILPGEVANFCLSEFNKNKNLRTCFKYSFIPTEMFFQTVISNSIFQNSITNNNMRYITWQKANTGHPDVLTISDKELMLKSECLFARKFDINKELEIFNFFEKNF